jgi:hypothetical protein
VRETMGPCGYERVYPYGTSCIDVIDKNIVCSIQIYYSHIPGDRAATLMDWHNDRGRLSRSRPLAYGSL